MSNYNDIVESCRYLLNNCPEAEPHLSYLDSRVNKEMQEKFGFGYFPPVNSLSLLTSLIGDSRLKDAELVYSKNMQDSVSARSLTVSYFEQHPLIMPYRDVYGNVIGLVGRTLLNDEQRAEAKVIKYKNTIFTKGNHLFGLYEAKDSILQKNMVYIVEGQFDVIKAFERGVTNIVALGNSSMTPFQLSLICRYSNNILLLLDNDDAGEKGRKRIIDKFGDLACINNVYLPKGYKDIDEYFSQNDGDSLEFVSRNVKYY